MPEQKFSPQRPRERGVSVPGERTLLASVLVLVFCEHELRKPVRIFRAPTVDESPSTRNASTNTAGAVRSPDTEAPRPLRLCGKFRPSPELCSLWQSEIYCADPSTS